MVDATAPDLTLNLPLSTAYFEHLAHERRYSPHTLTAYRRDLADFARFLQQDTGEKPTLNTLEALGPEAMSRFIRHMHAAELSRGSMNRRLSGVRSFFAWLARFKDIKNPHVTTTRGPRAQAPTPSALSLDDTEALMHHLVARVRKGGAKQKRDHALLLALYGLGLRISEALALNVQDISTDTLRLVGKGGKERRVPVLPAVRHGFDLWLEHHPGPKPTAPVFTAARGGRMGPRYAQRLLEQLRTELGLYEKLTPHVLRHCFATHLLRGGADLRAVQELLGHASLSTTQRYLSKDLAHILDVHSRAHPLEKGEF